MRSGSEVEGGGGGSCSHLNFTHSGTVCSMPVYYPHYAKEKIYGLSLMSVWMLASLSFAMVVYLNMVLYGTCLRYLSELPTVFYQQRLTLFCLMILTDC